MSDKRPPEEVSKELMIQAEDMVEKARQQVARHEELLEKLGVSGEQVRNYLKRTDKDRDNQNLVAEQVARINDDARKELREQRQAEKGSKPRGMGRRGAIRI